jgi:hypothetical protein
MHSKPKKGHRQKGGKAPDKSGLTKSRQMVIAAVVLSTHHMPQRHQPDSRPVRCMPYGTASSYRGCRHRALYQLVQLRLLTAQAPATESTPLLLLNGNCRLLHRQF